MTTLPFAATALAALLIHADPEPAKVPVGRHGLYDEATDGIELSSLPLEQRPRYELFAEKCKRCHSLGRSLLSGKRPEDWRQYARRMMKMAGKGLSEDDAFEIIDFLEYYSSWPPRK